MCDQKPADRSGGPGAVRGAGAEDSGCCRQVSPAKKKGGGGLPSQKKGEWWAPQLHRFPPVGGRQMGRAGRKVRTLSRDILYDDLNHFTLGSFSSPESHS